MGIAANRGRDGEAAGGSTGESASTRFVPLRPLGAGGPHGSLVGLLEDAQETGESAVLVVAHPVPREQALAVSRRVAPLIGRTFPGCLPLLRLLERGGQTWLCVRYVDGVSLGRLDLLPDVAFATVLRSAALRLADLCAAVPGLILSPPTAGHLIIDGAGGVHLLAPTLALRRDPTHGASSPSPGAAEGSATLPRALSDKELARSLANLGIERGSPAFAARLLPIVETTAGLTTLAAELAPCESGGAVALAAAARVALSRLGKVTVSPTPRDQRVTARVRPASRPGASRTRCPAKDGDLIDGRYRLRRLLGEGGMGRVFEAEHVGLGTRFAIKVLLPLDRNDPEALARMQREARMASRVRHPRIVQVYDVGSTRSGEPYIVMELCPGRNLGGVLQAAGSLAPERAVRLLLHVCDGIVAAHDAGVVHRDLKPGNILVTYNDGIEDIKVADFGLAVGVNGPLASEERLMGTPAYMAPELFASGRGACDGRLVDVYSLGVMLYELLSGQLPYAAPASLTNVPVPEQRGPPVPLAVHGVAVAPALEATIRAALDPDPTRRPHSVRELGAALASAAGLAIDGMLLRSLLSDVAGTPVFGVPIDPLIGRELAGYRVLGLLGDGTVYRGEHAHLGRRAVLKRLPDAVAGVPARLIDWIGGCRTEATLRHPAIARIEQIVTEGRLLTGVLVEEIPGPSLAELLTSRGAIDPARAVSLALEAARAIAVFHDRGLAHGAISPDHFVVARADDRLVLVDHGLTARSLGIASIARDVADLGRLLASLLERARDGRDANTARLRGRAIAIAADAIAATETGPRRFADASAVTAALEEAIATAATETKSEDPSAEPEVAPAAPTESRRLVPDPRDQTPLVASQAGIAVLPEAPASQPAGRDVGFARTLPMLTVPSWLRALEPTAPVERRAVSYRALLAPAIVVLVLFIAAIVALVARNGVARYPSRPRPTPGATLGAHGRPSPDQEAPRRQPR